MYIKKTCAQKTLLLPMAYTSSKAQSEHAKTVRRICFI